MNHTATCQRNFRRTGRWSATVLVKDDIWYGPLSIEGDNVAGCGLPRVHGRSEKSHTLGRWFAYDFIELSVFVQSNTWQPRNMC